MDSKLHGQAASMGIRERLTQYKQLRQASENPPRESYLPNYKQNKPSTAYMISLQGIKELSILDTSFKNDS
jgi:hypothetical protein